MKTGIVSDSHGKAGVLKRALSMLAERGAEAIVHCGDVGNSECIKALGETNLPTYAVAGNMDHHPRRLQSQADRDNVHFSVDTILVPLGNDKYLAATHGNNAGIMTEMLAKREFPYLCHGHTHQPRDDKIGPTRVINPGALRHAHPPTAAILDTDADTVEHFAVR
ncbi:MAG: metallophosphatase family protein [Phycisphaerae bacterium]|nr:metallophosphatase family protein [Phycisphaerae bacterium]